MSATTHMIAQHLAWMLAGGFATNTIHTVGRVLRRADRKLPYGLPVATGDELATLLARDDWSVQTRASYRQHLRRFYDWAVEDGWIDFDPSTRLRRPTVPPGVPRPATNGQVAAALGLASPWRMHAVLAAYGGLRCCEIAVIERRDITEDGMRVRGKGGRVRVVPTDAYVWRSVRDLPPGPVTRRPDGRSATAAWVSVRTAEYLRRHGLLVTLHMFRHWYATQALEACGNLRVVQELLGHSSPGTTAVYTKVSARQKAEAVAGLPRLAAG